MALRIGFGILFCLLSIVTMKAQLSRRDSIRLKELLEGEEEIKLNQEAVKNIQFDFASDTKGFQGKPRMSEEKEWMKLNINLPKNFNDTTIWRKPKYVRALPYTPTTRWNEDPVNDKLLHLKEDTLTFKLRLDYLKQYIPNHQPLVTFDTDKFLYENLTKRGRTIRRNRKRAKAWKTYNDYVPTKQDSLLFKHEVHRKDETEKSR